MESTDPTIVANKQLNLVDDSKPAEFQIQLVNKGINKKLGLDDSSEKVLFNTPFLRLATNMEATSSDGS